MTYSQRYHHEAYDQDGIKQQSQMYVHHFYDNRLNFKAAYFQSKLDNVVVVVSKYTQAEVIMSSKTITITVL